VKTYALVRPDGIVQQTLDSSGDMPDTLGDMRVVPYAGPTGVPLREVDGVIGPFEPEVEDPDAAGWAAIRAHRDRLLLDSDWTLGNDSPLGADAKAAWAVYRDALRRITDQPLNGLAWPMPPQR
jgi:hypothetical protein